MKKKLQLYIHIYYQTLNVWGNCNKLLEVVFKNNYTTTIVQYIYVYDDYKYGKINIILLFVLKNN